MYKKYNFILFILLIIIAFFLNNKNSINFNVFSTIKNSPEKTLLIKSKNFNINNNIFFITKDFSENSLKNIINANKELSDLNFLENKYFTTKKNYNIYLDKYYYFIKKLNKEKIKNLNVQQTLKKISNSYSNSFIPDEINEKDPLKIFYPKKNNIKLKNSLPYIENTGYLLIYSIKNKEYNQQKYYNIFKNIENKYNLISFSPFYYFIENSQYIKNDINKIALISLLALFFLYIYILKNLNLLIHTLVTLTSSILFAYIGLILLFKDFSILVLAFSIPISTISIDYMFHNYFHNYYNSKKTINFNKNVFFGFITTFGTFLIFSFSNFLLIKQICIFSLLSILYSYLVFNFIFQKINFKKTKLMFNKINFNFIKIKNLYIFIPSFIILFFIFNNLNLDLNIQNLNYNNPSLKEKEKKINNFFKKNYSTYIIKGSSIDKLIENNENLKKIDPLIISPLNNLVSKQKFQNKLKEFKKFKLLQLNKNINKYKENFNFNKTIFNKSYIYPTQMPNYNLLIKNLDILKHKNYYISYVNIPSKSPIIKKNINFLIPLSVKKLFEKNIKQEIKNILNLGFLALIFIFISLFITCKKNFIYSLNFLMFPSLTIFIYFYFTQPNILNIFMLFVIIGLSIDYSIYSSNNSSLATKNSILFSLLSTFIGFSLLSFSNIIPIKSIGYTSIIGIFSLIILLFIKKEKN